MGSNPGGVHWLDMTFFTFNCCGGYIVRLKRPKIKMKKRLGLDHFLKKLFKLNSTAKRGCREPPPLCGEILEQNQGFYENILGFERT